MYCILSRIYSLGLANLNLANLYMSTSSALERSLSQRTFQMSRHVNVTTGKGLKCELIQAVLPQSPVLKLDNSYVMFCEM